jgi:hypothetical protein
LAARRQQEHYSQQQAWEQQLDLQTMFNEAPVDSSIPNDL